MKKIYQGGCHCGAVRYQVQLDLGQGTFKCNCSICAKARSWLATAAAGDFRLLSGEAELTEYLFHRRRIHHLFCRRCGVRSFGWGEAPGSAPEAGGKFYAIHVNCLDDLAPEDLVNAPVAYIDGRGDRWQSAPPEFRHL